MPSYLEVTLASSNELVVKGKHADFTDGIGIRIPEEMIAVLESMGFYFGDGFVCSPSVEMQKKVQYPKEVKFRYFGDRSRVEHNGIITIATVIHENIVTYGAAFCNPHDRFNKETGKRLAYNRLMNDQFMVTIPKKTNRYITRAIICDIIANYDYPSWANNMINDVLLGCIWG